MTPTEKSTMKSLARAAALDMIEVYDGRIKELEAAFIEQTRRIAELEFTVKHLEDRI